MLKYVKEQIEAFVWLQNWINKRFKYKSIYNRYLLIIILLVVIILGSYKLYIFLQPKPATKDKITIHSEKNISSSGQYGGITAENVFINSPPSKISSFEEKDKKRTYTKNRLKQLYGEISVLSDYPIPSGDVDALQEYERRVNEWVSKTAMWIEINIGFGAREKFLNRGEGGRIWSSNYEARYNELVSGLKAYKLGLEELIKSDEIWFETDKGESGNAPLPSTRK